jgi:sulfite reductase (NADPH) flavoprotein alpha-component
LFFVLRIQQSVNSLLRTVGKMASGASTPVSQSTTLTNQSEVKGVFTMHVPTTSPAHVVLEQISSRSSSVIYLYDVARDVGIGHVSKGLSKEDKLSAPVVELQTRTGAGLLLLGRLTEGTSSQDENGAVITVYTTTRGLEEMAPSLELFPTPKANSRLVAHIAASTPVRGNLTLSSSLASLSTFFATVPDHFTVVLSATPQEVMDVAAATYGISNAHIVHIFDQNSAGREVSEKLVPPSASTSPVFDTYTALNKAGYEYFEYAGDVHAENVIVLLNGPLALALKAVASQVPSVGILIVRVLRPWDESAFLRALPSTSIGVHVWDDVASEHSSTPLYNDVIGSILQSPKYAAPVRSQKLVPELYCQIASSTRHLLAFISQTLSINWLTLPKLNPLHDGHKIVLYTTPRSSSAALPNFAARPFLGSQSIRARLLTQGDAFSKPGGVVRSTLLLSQKSGTTDVPIEMEVGGEPDTDFVVVADQSLLKTHNVLEGVKPGSGLLLVTPWNVDEIISNMHPENLATIQASGLQVYAVNPPNKNSEALSVALAFLRLYLGSFGTEKVVMNLATAAFSQETFGCQISSLVAETLSNLVAIEITGDTPGVAASEDAALQRFSFNTIVFVDEVPSTSFGVKVGPLVEAAKYILFREAFAATNEPAEHEEHPQVLGLRPDVPERTFLVTCTVNRRLTPLDYNRNVFHLEFDTSGTGLKYAIGEALGVHGWNDAGEVLDFCDWYGLDLRQVISMPVPGDPTRKHTRTVFQAFQQQIDIFGQPPKGFYATLVAYAKEKEDQMALRFISAAEGSSTFKKLSELETVTFADVLKKFPSARPPVEQLCEIVGDIKPRHYSIASAQSVVGDRVDLLVVTVDWVTPSGA